MMRKIEIIAPLILIFLTIGCQPKRTNLDTGGDSATSQGELQIRFEEKPVDEKGGYFYILSPSNTSSVSFCLSNQSSQPPKDCSSKIHKTIFISKTGAGHVFKSLDVFYRTVDQTFRFTAYSDSLSESVATEEYLLQRNPNDLNGNPGTSEYAPPPTINNFKYYRSRQRSNR
jgi:hypothetical protein